jgi:hypothetical protein
MNKILILPLIALSANAFASPDALLIHGQGIDACPQDRFCIYGDAEYNIGWSHDLILVIKGNVQINSKQLNDFGFPVGERDGVSSIVNKLEVVSNLAQGADISGNTLKVNPGENINVLQHDWNDQVNSIITQAVININTPMAMPSKVIEVGKNNSAELTIDNSRGDQSFEVSLDVQGTKGLFSIDDYESEFTVPAREVVKKEISITGEEIGRGTLIATMKPEIGYVNQSSNTALATITVEVHEIPDLHVSQSFDRSWESWWPEHEWYFTYNLDLISDVLIVKHWKLSFSLPEGAYIPQEWLDSQASWLILNTEESVNGKVVLENTSGHNISPSSDIKLHLEVHYLDNQVEHQTLQDLTIEEVG